MIVLKMPEGEISRRFVARESDAQGDTYLGELCVWCNRKIIAGRRVRAIGDRLIHDRCVKPLAKIFDVRLP